MLSPDEERRLAALEEQAEETTRRIDEVYQLVGQLVVHDARPEAGGKPAPAPEEKPRWWELLPVKWIALWVCGIVTLMLATYGFIRTELLEGLWKLLSGTVAP